MKDLLTIIDESDSTCLASYKRIAEKLMNDYTLRVKDKWYRIVECEFYYSSEKHNDPYVHGHMRQKETNGEWYFHGSGLDITLSNGGAFGGILIRGIVEVKTENHVPARKDATIGPLNVCTEIFSEIGNALANAPFYFGLIDISREPMGAIVKTAKVFSVPRIGLNETKDSKEGYCGRPYRFITFLHLPHREVDKVKKYLTEFAKEPMSREEYKEYYTGQKW